MSGRYGDIILISAESPLSVRHTCLKAPRTARSMHPGHNTGEDFRVKSLIRRDEASSG